MLPSSKVNLMLRFVLKLFKLNQADDFIDFNKCV